MTMTTIPRVLAVTVGLAMTSAALLARAPESNTDAKPLKCAEALPDSYDVFARCSLADRKDAYRHLPIEVRRGLWREHLASFLQPRSTLTAAQRAVVVTAMANLDDYIVAHEDSVASRSAMARDGMTAKELKAVFGDSLARAMFAILGPDERVNGHTVGEAPIEANMPKPKGTPECSCSVVSDWCCHGQCQGGGCAIVEDECGTFWVYQCNGLCQTVS
jgi:hypothetical protein